MIALPQRTSKGTTWVIGGVSAEARTLGPFRELPLDDAVGLSAAPSEDGTLFVGTSSNVSAGGGFHAWSASISATFQGPGAVVESADLFSQAGEGRGGLYGLPLVRGAWAGAVVVPTGHASHSDSKVIMIRRPCESGSIP